jgi:Ca-activated chloride channel family protein
LRVHVEPRKTIDVGNGLPVRIAIALDLSGSMAGEKFAKAKEACRQVVQMLRPQDRLWLCGFATELIPVIECQAGGPDGVEAAAAMLRRLQPNGVTRTELGLEWALQSLSAPGNETRIAIMITDGHATDARGKPLEETESLVSIADRMARVGINLSAVGLGDAENFNTAFLVALADRGKGAFIYADTPQSLTSALVNRLSHAQSMGATSGVLDIALASDAKVNGVCRIRPAFVPLEGVQEPAGYHVELGPLRSDGPTDILLDIEVPAPDAVDSLRVADVRLSASSAAVSASASLKNTSSYAVAQERNTGVDKDRLTWELNLFTTELGQARDPRKTASLLENIQRTATKTGDKMIADEAAEQIVDLRKTGKLTPHRTTGLLTAARNQGE